MLPQPVLGSYDISIHAPPRGATECGNFDKRPNQHFNSRPSARGDVQFNMEGLMRGISIHAPPRGATRLSVSSLRLMSISIHAPPRGATASPVEPSRVPNISIHAPPRGATIPDDVDRSADFISIHAPPRGATLSASARSGGWRNFNSRPSARGDTSTSNPKPTAYISIHAPPRGAT